jgi:UDP-N-acetylglucosamine--N-acetylmuramyl-(pentapeptide) pyrophosphoryl-undecaprenol N-acetylglucosamine transferase
LVRESLPELTKHFIVVHQTGPNNDWDLPAAERYKPYAYIRDEMPQVIAAADLVLGRSGAGTVWEIATVGKPMALIPLRGSGTRGDQVENAAFFEKAGAAVMLLPAASEGESAAISPEFLVRVIRDLAEDREKLTAMAAAAAAIGKTDGAAIIAEALVRAIAKGEGNKA